jgi:hypothetical protein
MLKLLFLRLIFTPLEQLQEQFSVKVMQMPFFVADMHAMASSKHFMTIATLINTKLAALIKALTKQYVINDK